MISEEEKNKIETLRNANLKVNLNYLMGIRNRETNTNKTNCWCSTKDRSRFITNFFIWYDEYVK